MAKSIRIPLAGLALTTLALAAAAQSSSAQAAQTRDYHIESQPLPAAVNEWADQAGLQVMWSAQMSGAQREAPEVAGRFSAPVALERVLQGSGLTFAFLDEQTVAIRLARVAGDVTAASPSQGENQGAGKTAARTSATGEMLAQNDDHRAASASSQGANPPPGSKGENIDEIIVTGSLLRRQKDEAAPLIVLDQRAIEQSGQATISRVIRELPQNFRGNSEQVDIDPNGTNLGGGSGINLRGLGLDTTLVLVNGKRLAKGGMGGTFFDLDSIPASAVDRIEVLTAGASATYGADAIGGVVNIIMKQRYDGVQLQARRGEGTQSGSYGESDFGASVGTSWSSGTAFGAFNLNDQDLLTQSDRRFSRSNDFRSLGGANFQPAFGAPGNIRATDGVLNSSGLSTPAGVFVPLPELSAGQTLTPNLVVAAPARTTDIAVRDTLVPDQQRIGAYFSVAQDLSDRFHFYANVLGARREYEATGRYPTFTAAVPATNPFNPFGEAVQVRYVFTQTPPVSRSTTHDYGGTAGLTMDLSNWRADASFTYGRETIDQEGVGQTIDSVAVNALLASTTPATSINFFGGPDGISAQTLAAIQRTNLSTSDTDEWSGRLVFDGPVNIGLALPAMLAMGFEHRESGIDTSQINFNGTNVAFQAASKNVESASAVFTELLLPLLENASFAQRLELILAGRFEHTVNDDVAVPKVSMLWHPISTLSFNASWGRSFKSPLLRDLSEATQETIFTLSIIDPKTGAATTPNVTLISGGNADLLPEEAETFTFNALYQPANLPGFAAGIGYFDIVFDNRIVQPALAFIVQNEDNIPGAITRGPAGPSGVGPITRMDLRARNLAVVTTSGVDLDLNYAHEMVGGSLTTSLNLTYITEYDTQVYDNAPNVAVVDTLGYPPRVRASANLNWTSGHWSLGTNVAFSDDYRDSTLPSARLIGSHTTVDFRGAYEIPVRESNFILGGTRLAVGVNNAFDRDPPFRNALSGYDPAVADPRGRLVYLELRKVW